MGSGGAGCGSGRVQRGAVPHLATTREGPLLPVLTPTQYDEVRRFGRWRPVYVVGTERGEILVRGLSLAGAIRFCTWFLGYYQTCDLSAVSTWDEWIRAVLPWDD